MIRDTTAPRFIRIENVDGDNILVFKFDGEKVFTCDMCKNIETIYPTDQEFEMYEWEFKETLMKNNDLFRMRFYPFLKREFRNEKITFMHYDELIGSVETTLHICHDCLSTIEKNRENDRFKKMMKIL